TDDPPESSPRLPAKGRVNQRNQQAAGFKDAGNGEGDAQITVANGADQVPEQGLELVAVEVVDQAARDDNARVLRRAANGSRIGAGRIQQHQLGRRQAGSDGHFLDYVCKLQLLQVTLIRFAGIQAGQRAACSAAAEERHYAEPQT